MTDSATVSYSTTFPVAVSYCKQYQSRRVYVIKAAILTHELRSFRRTIFQQPLSVFYYRKMEKVALIASEPLSFITYMIIYRHTPLTIPFFRSFGNIIALVGVVSRRQFKSQRLLVILMLRAEYTPACRVWFSKSRSQAHDSVHDTQL